MSSRGRYNHPISLNQEQEELVNEAREIDEWSYAEMVVMAAQMIIKNKIKKSK